MAFWKMNSVEFDLFLHAEPRRRSVLVYREFRMAALVAVSAVRLDRVSAMGRAAGVGGGARKAGGQPGTPLRSIARQARRSAGSSGHSVVVEAEGVGSLADGALRSYVRSGGRRAVACACACHVPLPVPVPVRYLYLVTLLLIQAICQDPIRVADTQSGHLSCTRPLAPTPSPPPQPASDCRMPPPRPHSRRPPSLSPPRRTYPLLPFVAPAAKDI